MLHRADRVVNSDFHVRSFAYSDAAQGLAIVTEFKEEALGRDWGPNLNISTVFGVGKGSHDESVTTLR